MTVVSNDVETVIRATVELADRISDRGLEIEQSGRLPADIAAALRESGVFRLWLPVELGGIEADPVEVIDIIRMLAAADASTGWCAATGIASNIAGALLPESGAREVFATGDEVCGGALMPGGRAIAQPDGSYLVDGRWSFGSGTHHCDWLVGGAVVIDDRPPAGGASALRAVVMPAAAVRFHDNWDAFGLSGTGSVDYEVSGLSVPADHTIDMTRMTPWPAGSMWRIPLRSLLYPILGAVPLGIAQRAVDDLVLLAGGRTRFGSTRVLADREVVQFEVARAQAMIDSGAAYLEQSLGRLAAVAKAGQVPGAAARAAARLAAVFVSEQSARAVELCFRQAGTAAIHRDSGLQRALRDVNTASQHYALSAPGYELAGRVLLGFEPDLLL